MPAIICGQLESTMNILKTGHPENGRIIAKDSVSKAINMIQQKKCSRISKKKFIILKHIFQEINFLSKFAPPIAVLGH